MSPGAPVRAVELTQSDTKGIGIAGVRRDRVDISAGVGQAVGEITELVGAASDQRDAETTDREPAGDRHAETRPGTDQEQVSAINRADTIACPSIVGAASCHVRSSAGPGSGGDEDQRADRVGCEGASNRDLEVTWHLNVHSAVQIATLTWPCVPR